MRRVLFLTIVLVLLLGTVGTASAQTVGDYDETALGDIWPYYAWTGEPGAAVDIKLYRPSTEAGWPLPEGPYAGTGFAVIGDSEWRRQSYPAYQFADELGYYFAEFMFPRDEAWYPCGYPYRWKCNFPHPEEGYVEFHSPVAQRLVDPNTGEILFSWFEGFLLWPYFDSIYYEATDDFAGAWALANPMDTVAPLWAGIFVDDVLIHTEPYEVLGYFWKISDLEYDPGPFGEDFEFIPVP